MIITCGQCLAKFKVAPEQIKETGSKVRCSNCQHVFTVYRPGFEPDDREDSSSLLYRPGGSSEADFRREDGHLYDQSGDDHFDDDDYGGDQDYDDDPDDDLYSADYPSQERYSAGGRDEVDSLSLKERRDRRRRLYADIEETDQDNEVEEDLYYESEDLVGEDGRPPLRRAAARAAQQARHDDEAYTDEVYDEEEEYEEEEYEEEEYEEEYEEEEEYGEYDDSAYEEDDDEYEVPARNERRTSLGLAADPVENVAGFIDDADYRGSGRGADGAERRAAVTKVSSRLPLPLIIILAIVVIVLAIGAITFFTGRSAPTALSAGDTPIGSSTDPASGGQGLIDNDKADNDGTKHITFTPNSQNHYWRQNDEAGQILVVTGMVRNSYPEPRSYIHLRGHILAGDDTSLAERYVYAGNLISEEELKTLPSKEILNRLLNKGGQNGRNMNIPSGAEIPFMVVFDKLPDGMAEYRVVPVGSSPAQ